MSRRRVNLEDVFDVERIGPSYADMTFGLTFRGQTPGGKELDVSVRMPSWGVEYIAEKLHEVLKEQSRFVDANRKALRGEQ